MFNALTRLQTSFGYFTTVLSFFCVAVSISSLAQLYFDGAFGVTTHISSITPKITNKFTRHFGSTDGKSKENCRIGLDLNADLSPLFNWNTKQVFVYLTAEYPGRRPDINNKVTFWDKIIVDKKDANLKLSKLRGKYSVYDVDRQFKGQNATVRLEWNVQPWVGWMTFGSTIVEGEGSSFIFPEVV